jgi:drug/metabolite transporter (DMT)-like permease
MWGVLPIALKITLQEMDALTITWYRFTVAALLLGSYLAIRNKLPELRGHPVTIYVLLVLVILGLASNYVFFILGLSHISAETAQVLIQLAPALATLGSLILFKERFSRLQWCGFFTIGLGMLLFFHNKLGEVFLRLGSYSVGVMLIVLAAITWAMYALTQKQLLNVMSSSGVLLVVYGGSMLALLPTAVPTTILKLSTLHFWLLLFCALNTIIAYGSFSEALAHWEASRVSAIAALTPVITLLTERLGSNWWPHLVASEKLTTYASIGAFFVVTGSMSIALGHSNKTEA